LGGILAGVAFLCSAIVELQLEKTYPILPGAGESQLRIFNGLPCNYTIQSSLPGDNAIIVLDGMNSFVDKYIDVRQTTVYPYTMTPTDSEQGCRTFTGSFNLTSGTAKSYFMRESDVLEYVDEPNKSRTGDPTLRILVNSPNVRQMKVVDLNHPDNLVRFNEVTSNYTMIQLVSSTYNISFGNFIHKYEITQGAVNTLIAREISADNFAFENVVVADPNSMHMLYLLPQYIIMTLGEVMYSVTGLAFSYAEAPVSMKSVLQSCWLLTVAFGNVIDIIIIGARGFSSQAHEFFLFAGLMFVDMIIFMILAYRYKSIPSASDQEQLIKDQSTNGLQGTEPIEGKKEGLDNVSFKQD